MRHGGRWVAAVAVGTWLLGACGGGADHAGTSGPAKRTAKSEDASDPAVAEATKRTTAAMSLGTSRAPVEVRYAYAAVPEAGKALDVEVDVIPQSTAPTVRVEVRTDPELQLHSPLEVVEFEKVQAGTLHTVKVAATPTRAGTSTVTVVVTLEQPTGPESRSFQFPVVVPGAPAPGAKS
jgi:hypothetical protein